MSARLLATLSLIPVLVPILHSEVAGTNTLLIYVDATVNADTPTLPFMRREAALLMRSAGYHIEWRETHGRRSHEAAPNLALVELKGICALPATPAPMAASPEDGAVPVASTPVVDGIVLPFSKIDCTALTNIIAPMLVREPGAQRSYYYGRAMGRLLAHELYHVLAQTRDHSSSGVGKPCFTSLDLISDRFEFESVALARLRRPLTRATELESTPLATRR